MPEGDIENLILISARVEWEAVKRHMNPQLLMDHPFGESFRAEIGGHAVVFFQGGWGKVSAAASAQYAIDHYKPRVIINLGTCGGFSGCVQKGEILLAEETIIYDIWERMGDPAEAIIFYSARPDLSWIEKKIPSPVRRVRLVSGDRDINPDEIDMLKTRFGAVAADWESGAIAWVAECNRIPYLILRGVSDIVSADGGEAYGNIRIFEEGSRLVMQKLLDLLPNWLK